MQYQLILTVGTKLFVCRRLQTEQTLDKYPPARDKTNRVHFPCQIRGTVTTLAGQSDASYCLETINNNTFTTYL